VASSYVEYLHATVTKDECPDIKKNKKNKDSVLQNESERASERERERERVTI